jgi:hypothetical protein
MEATYSTILEQLAGSNADRSALLKQYFEPEAGQPTHIPQAGHHAIAELVKAGIIRLIITTNFDRLLERALEEHGVSPTIVSTEDDATGALPIQHTPCYILKLHGDYKDIRTRNTIDELTSYGPQMTRVLDKALDEYGLIICGWSGDYDVALKAAIARASNRRFATYWTYRTGLSEDSLRLATLRGATTIQITDADSFFQTIWSNVQAHANRAAAAPASKSVSSMPIEGALEELSYDLSQEHLAHKIERSLMAEAKLLGQEFNSGDFAFKTQISKEEFNRRILAIDQLAERFVRMFGRVCYLGTKAHASLIRKAFAIMAEHPRCDWILGLYPALRIYYHGALACIASDNYILLSVLTKIEVSESSRSVKAAPILLYPDNVIEPANQKLLNERERNFTPLSNYLHDTLKDYCADYFPRDRHYTNAFDRWEYLNALLHASLTMERSFGPYVPAGAFLWRERERGGVGVRQQLQQELEEAGTGHPLVSSGFFAAGYPRLMEVKALVDAAYRKVPFGW